MCQYKCINFAMEVLRHAKWRVTVNNRTEALRWTDPVVTWLFGLIVCVCVSEWVTIFLWLCYCVMLPVVCSWQLEKMSAVGVKKNVHLISNMASTSMTGSTDSGVSLEYQKQPTTTLGKCGVQDHHSVTYYTVWGVLTLSKIYQLPLPIFNIAHSVIIHTHSGVFMCSDEWCLWYFSDKTMALYKEHTKNTVLVIQLFSWRDVAKSGPLKFPYQSALHSTNPAIRYIPNF